MSTRSEFTNQFQKASLSGEPSKIGNKPQNCVQANGLLDNEFCEKRRNSLLISFVQSFVE